MKNKLVLCPTLLFVLLISNSIAIAQTFTDLPGPMGTARTILKTANGELYLGSSTKGVFRSLNNGQSWAGFGGNTIMTGRINALVVDSSKQLIAATEQGGIKRWNGSAWVNSNAGLLTSCGITIPIRAIVSDSSGTLFAGAHGFSACFPNGDLYRYDGSSWTSIAIGLGNTNVNSLATDPISGDLFAGTDGGVFQFDGNSWSGLNAGLTDSIVHKIVFAANGDLFAGTNAGVAKLAHNSAVWVNLNNGLNGIPVHAIALDEDPAHLLIGVGYSLEQTGTLYGQLYETQDGGNNWVQIAPDLQTTVIHDLAFVGNAICLAAGWGIFKSADNGQTWATSNTGFSAKTFNTQGRVAVSPAPNHALFYGSDDGLFRSQDEGQTWTMASQGLTRHMVTLVKSDHFGHLFCSVMRYLGENSVGFGDGVLYKSTDNGDHWIPVAISKDWRYMEMSELANGDLICAHGFGAQPPSATITGSSLARSTDHGDSWTDLDVKSGMAFCCAANASGDLFVAGESQSVYRSTDGGNSFDLIVAPGQAGNVGTLEVSPTGDILMGSGGQRTFFFSTDNGANYTSFNSPVLPDYHGVSDVVFDDLGTAYCTTSGQGGSPALFTVSPPFTANSVFVPVPGFTLGSLFKMTWDECGYLYIYRTGGILKSSLPLRMPEAGCLSATKFANDKPNTISVSPNPMADLLQLHCDNPEEIEVEIWDLNGQKVLESAFREDCSIVVKTLPSGMYLLKAKMGNRAAQCLKIVKDAN